MPAIEPERTLPAGAIATALAMVETLSGRDDGRPPKEVATELAAYVDAWGRDTVTEALGALIYTAMKVARPAPGTEDMLHLIVPAVLTKFHRMQMIEVPDEVLPTVAGMLTAAFFDQGPYEWRTSLGPIPDHELLIWLYTAWLLIDFLDTAVFDTPGQFARIVSGIVGLDEPDQDEDPLRGDDRCRGTD